MYSSCYAEDKNDAKSTIAYRNDIIHGKLTNGIMGVYKRRFHLQNFSVECFRVMNELRKAQELCDVILRVGDTEFPVHRVILAGISPYLRAMFTNGMLESCQKQVDIGGLDSRTMELLIEFAYTGTIEVNVDNVQQLLAGASLLNVTPLRNACSSFLQGQLDASNCLGIREFADLYSCNDLEVAARRYMCLHFVEVIKSDEFLQLCFRQLIELLKSDKIQVRSEEDIYSAFESWLFFDYDNRKQYAHQVLECVRIPLLSLEFLESRVFSAPFIKNNTSCQLVLAKVMNEHTEDLPKFLSTPRALPQSIYAVGGRNSVECQLGSLERYDVYRDEWIIEKGMGIARTAVGSCGLNGLLFTVGGECAVNTPHDDTLYLRCVECYDPNEKRWYRVADIGVQRSFVSVIACSGCLYALGGEDRSCSYSLVEKYNPQKDVWVPVQSMKRKRSGAGVTVYEGMIFVAGGYDRSVHSDRASVECYSPDADQWTFVAELEKARSGLVLVTLDNFIYAIGGRNRGNDHYFNLCERYNPATFQWTAVAPMNTPRAWPAAGVLDGKIFIIGGFDGANRLSSVEMYDPEEDTWRHVCNMNICRAGCGAAVV